MNQIYQVSAPDREITYPITYPRQLVEQLRQTAKKNG